MANVVGTLEIDLRARIARLQEDLGKARQEMRKASDGMRDEFRRSSQESRQQLMILGDAIGVRLPREIRKVIVESQAAQIAIGAIFKIAGPIAFGAVIIERLIPAFKKLHEVLMDTKALEEKVTSTAGFLKALHDITEEAKKLNDEYQKIGKTAQQIAFINLYNLQIDRARLALQLVALESLKGSYEAMAKRRPELPDLTGQTAGAAQSYAEWQKETKAAADMTEALDERIHKMNATLGNVDLAIRNASAALNFEFGKGAAKAAKEAEAAAKKFDEMQFKLMQIRDKTQPLPGGKQESDRQYIPGEFREGIVMRPWPGEVSAEGADKYLKETSKILEDAKTNAEKYSEALTAINFTMQKGSPEYAKALDAIKQKYDDNTIAVRQFGQEVGDALQQGILMGRSWSDVLKTILFDVIKLIAQMTILKSINAEGGGGGFLGSLLGGLVGMRAAGGPINAGMPYIVGESGPELIVPGTSGTVVPNDRVGGISITNYNDFRGADASIMPIIDKKIEAASRRTVQIAITALNEQRARR